MIQIKDIKDYIYVKDDTRVYFWVEGNRIVTGFILMFE